jgi:hypothetical protein
MKVWNGSSWVSAISLRVWNGSSWVSATSGKVWNGSSWVSFFNSVAFTPEGGASAGAAVLVQSDVAYQEAEVIISCTQNATWNYTKTLTSGLGTEFVNIPTGSVATEIIFRFDSTFGQNSRRTYSLNATSGGITQYWTIDLRSDYS